MVWLNKLKYSSDESIRFVGTCKSKVWLNNVSGRCEVECLFLFGGV